jgi:hypothetical protein
VANGNTGNSKITDRDEAINKISSEVDSLLTAVKNG